MKAFILLIAINMASFACVVGATVLALNAREGWGWLIFAAIVTRVSVSQVRRA